LGKRGGKEKTRGLTDKGTKVGCKGLTKISHTLAAREGMINGREVKSLSLGNDDE